MSFKNERILKCKYYAHGGSGSGETPDSPAPFTDADIMPIYAGMVLEGVDVIIQVALGGVTAVLVGDDDDNDGFVAAADVTEATPAVYAGAGAYLASGAKKYYAAEGKEVKADFTGTSSAGSCVVIVKGYRV